MHEEAPTARVNHLIAGPSDMAARIRAYNWSRTSFGAD